MRVIAGTARSLPLKAPEGMETRPTTDRIKETLFNMLQNRIGGAVFADVFSGSGGIGIEALSRGASKAYFIENNKKALSCIQENLRFTKLEKSSMIMNTDACAAIDRITEVVDIIFMDPPYSSGLDLAVLERLKSTSCVGEETLIIIEADLKNDSSKYEALGFTKTKEKVYKTNKHVFLVRGEQNE
ncbi:MAG: 16S rRNA (guanine(966)-N(2))-methyltransferase RsmD [Lachnospiraceae bacterium]|nr:16S rRNA (guanine(966)-N(2))-methyltransferase RsmD [Lachnospiraceae bacterium]